MWISKREYEGLCIAMVRAEQLEKENKWLQEKSYIVSLLKSHNKSISSLLTISDAHFMNGHIVFPDNVPQYVDDIFGGRVIKQEAFKGIVIDKDGNVKTGLTKLPPDIGYSYKLEQNKI